MDFRGTSVWNIKVRGSAYQRYEGMKVRGYAYPGYEGMNIRCTRVSGLRVGQGEGGRGGGGGAVTS